MKRFDVYSASGNRGYLLVVQSDYLQGFRTQAVVPIVPRNRWPKQMPRLHPVVRIADQDFIIATHLLFAVPQSELKHHVCSLSDMHTEIIAALDMLFSGV